MIMQQATRTRAAIVVSLWIILRMPGQPILT